MLYCVGGLRRAGDLRCVRFVASEACSTSDVCGASEVCAIGGLRRV